MAFLMVVFTARIPAGPPTPMDSGNGELNGDGEIDVSDAVHLLFYLFRGGEPPAAIAASSAIVDEKIVEIAEQHATASRIESLLGIKGTVYGGS